MDLVDLELLVLRVQQVRQDFRELPEQLVFREVAVHRDLADLPERPDQWVSLCSPLLENVVSASPVIVSFQRQLKHFRFSDPSVASTLFDYLDRHKVTD